MSDPEILRPVPEADSGEKGSPGPSLTLLYSIIAFALAIAIGLALMIVFPFYRGR
jgi:hypothetical protein